MIDYGIGIDNYNYTKYNKRSFPENLVDFGAFCDK